jgi:type I restriction enzyme R subunit
VRQPERDEVERPLIAQLVAMGWTHLQFGSPEPYLAEHEGSGRDSFADAVLLDRFRAAVRKINPGPDGQPWLDPERVSSIVNRVVRDTDRGAAGNIAFTELLTSKALTVDGFPDWDNGAAQDIRLVDWDHPDNNDLLVISQFRVATPGGSQPYVVLDLVLFVNGLPFVIIEGKDPAPTALTRAVGQLITNCGASSRDAAADLTRFAQLLVATDREGALYGTVTSDTEHFAPWRSVDPKGEAKIKAEVGKLDHLPLLAQEVLAGQMLRPVCLFDLIRNFIASMPAGPRQAKIVARWVQYRAVRAMAARLQERRRRLVADATAPPDHRGGVIWHTQGSGKSLTMTFLVRVLRSDPDLARFKVVVVTDRIDLETQIRGSLRSSGQTPRRATSAEGARRDLARETPDLILMTIQKAQRDEDADDGSEETLGEVPRVFVEVANNEPDIVVLVDEAHRSQDAWLHARLRAMLPNAVLIGFTGTPILSGTRKHTEDIFGRILDAYTLKHAERDKAVVPVRYESWSVGADLVDRAVLDAGFLNTVPDDPTERQRAIGRFARSTEVLEATPLIAAKAENMLLHWIRNVMPDRFSAQVVAVSRKAAVRYQQALLAARDKILDELDALPPSVRHDPLGDADERTKLLLAASLHREVLENLDVVPVISEGPRYPAGGARADPPEWREWTDKGNQQKHIDRFKAGLGEVRITDTDPGWSGRSGELDLSHPIDTYGIEQWAGPLDGQPAVDRHGDSVEPLAFLTVRSMLLTGFDAPVEQVLYLDRELKSVELLQAIARTNRPRKNKAFGLVVDYVGTIAGELARVMAQYDSDHLKTVIGDTDPRVILPPLDDVTPSWLLQHYHRVTTLLSDHAISSLSTLADREELLNKLDDPELRASFDERTRDFLKALNSVLPRPDALAYEGFARHLGTIQYLARRRYRDGRAEYSPFQYGEKIRLLIDAHITAEDVLQRVPPVNITAYDFVEKVNGLPDDRARALEMKHALRDQIAVRIDSDRVTYQRLSERLDEVIQQMEDDHDFGQAVMNLLGLRDEVVAEETTANENDLDRWTEKPVYSLLERALSELSAVDTVAKVDLVFRARELSVMIGHAVEVPHFLFNHVVRERVRRELVRHLVIQLKFKQDLAGKTVDELVALAARNRDWFLRLVRE